MPELLEINSNGTVHAFPRCKKFRGGISNEKSFYHIAIAGAGTRPLVALEFPEVKKMMEQKKEEVKKAEIQEELKNMDIEEVIAIQNLPTSLQCWKKPKVLMPTQLLAVATHYFIYSQAVQHAPMTNKGVAEKFKVPVRSLHRITSGRRYMGGHATQKGQQAEHGEVVVKVSKKKKEKGKTVVTKVPTTVIATGPYMPSPVVKSFEVG